MIRKAKEEEGATHWFKCSMGDSCGAWVEVWIPKVVPKVFLKLTLYCGFCAAEKLDSQEKATEQLQNQLQLSTTTVEALKSDASSYSTILQGFRKKEAESKRKAKNVIVWGVKKADEPKDKEFMLQLSADLGTDIDVTSTKRIDKENENGEQLILVSLTLELQAQNILKLAKKLKEFEHYTNIYINKDLTKSQQLENEKLREELKAVRREDPDGVYFIKHNRVTKKN